MVEILFDLRESERKQGGKLRYRNKFVFSFFNLNFKFYFFLFFFFQPNKPLIFCWDEKWNNKISIKIEEK